tara:strand:- start:1410 stop:1544 length:135 start_codon:yes stop_codon:yes gene_type:complete
MNDDFLNELIDLPAEIYDIPEMAEFDDQFDDKSFENSLNGEYDF